jgi:hypothetical protein
MREARNIIESCHVRIPLIVTAIAILDCEVNTSSKVILGTGGREYRIFALQDSNAIKGNGVSL